MDALGQPGVQLFVDAGRPVDDSLVHTLIREVLHEKLASMVGSRFLADVSRGSAGDGFPLPPAQAGASSAGTADADARRPVVPEIIAEVKQEEVCFFLNSKVFCIIFFVSHQSSVEVCKKFALLILLSVCQVKEGDAILHQ